LSSKLSARVENAVRRVEYLHQGDLPDQELTAKLNEELSSALEELQAATLELLTQNEQLTSSRQELEDERRRYQELFNFAPDGYLVTDTEGIILNANSAAAGLFNLKKPFLIGRPLALFVGQQERDHFRERLAQIKKGAEVHRGDWEFVMQPNKGAAFPASISIKHVTTVRAKTGELRWLMRDMTLRKQMEKELQKADKLESLGILAGGIAHDFNNYLTVILGNLSLLKMYLKKDEKAFRYLQEMEKAIGQTKNLTKQLLTFAKGGSPITKAVSIRNFIEEVSAFSLSGSKASYEFSFSANLPLVEIDSGQMTQVMSNLLINADQSMQEGGNIKISADCINIARDSVLPLRPGIYVAITITDEGSGIPNEHLTKIFDPYFTTKEKGNGLGLTICYSIVSKHGGHISVKSMEGQGTDITVYLPASHAKTASEATEEMLFWGKGKVLLMDDEESVRQTAGEMLTFLGYDAEFARDGAELIRLYKEALNSDSPFDAIITDLTVRGGMGGKKAVAELLEIDPEVKAIASSGYSNDELLSNFVEHGFCGVVAKPYRLHELGEALSKAVKKRND
jgi:two-component system, cell cycle sensor histidine kinase and response regulator CckA